MNDLDLLQQLNGHFIRSVRESDTKWFAGNLSDDFLNSNPDGSLADRTGFLVQIARPCPVLNFDAEDVRIRILGDTAVIHGRTIYNKQDGQRATGRYTDVWMRRQGRWNCVAAHVTRG